MQPDLYNGRIIVVVVVCIHLDINVIRGHNSNVCTQSSTIFISHFKDNILTWPFPSECGSAIYDRVSKGTSGAKF